MTAKTARLTLDALDARLTPSVTTLDLTARGATATASGAIFRQQSTVDGGSRNLDVFLGLQTEGRRQYVEQGYNSDARPVQFDEASSRQRNHSLKLSQVPTVVVDGTYYREFVLDVSERPSSPRISLDELRVYVGDTGKVKGYNPRTGTLNGMAAVYNLDAAQDVSVVLNAKRGTGQADMVALIPDAAFAGKSGSDFVSLYSKFGGEFGADGGEEQWAVRVNFTAPPPPTQPPAAGTASLSGSVFVDSNMNGTKDDGEVGIDGATITLSKLGADGNYTVVGTVTLGTDVTTYSFQNLAAGTYKLEVSTPGYTSGMTQPGSSGGGDPNDDNCTISNIALDDGVQGADYNFDRFPAVG